MTGNTKVWRAPLAGLASLAMLATMGVAAGTANAAVTNKAADASVIDVSVPTGYSASVTRGESYADVISSGSSLTPALLDSNPSTAAFGGFKVNGNFVPLTGQVQDGDKIEFANYDASKGVKLHYVTKQGTTVVSLGYVWVPAQVLNGSTVVTVKPGQTPYDVADGWKLDLSKSTANTKSVDLSNGGSFTLAGDKRGAEVQVNVTSVKGNMLTFQGGSDSRYTIVYPGAKADTDTFTSAYSVDVPVDGTFDPQTVIDAANINLKATADQALKFGISQFNLYGSTTQFTANTKVTKDTVVSPKVDQAFTVKFKVNGKIDDKLTQSVVENGLASKPADPVATDGSVFQGWYVDADNDGTLDDNESLFDFAGTPVTANITLSAWWANGGSHTLTYKFADGKTADKTETYVAKQNTARPADPTRDGFIFAGWYADANNDGTLDQSEVTGTDSKGNTYDKAFTFGQELTADTTLIARWLQADDATLEAALRYVNGSDESNNKDQYDGLFTAASFKEYVATYQGVQKKYADAKNAATAKGEQIPAETFTSLLNELVAGWKKLEFVHTGELTKADAIVHRLSKGNDHFYTQDSNELKGLTNKDFTGVWNDEGELFQTVPKADKPEFYSTLSDFKTAARNNADVEKTLDTVADPILTKVTRLYNRVNGDHVWTVDQNEVDFLSAQAAWNNESTAFFVPRYTGSQPVTRLAKGARHLLSTDANEVKVLTADGWGNEGVAFKAY